ncbi:SMP-30/gluconolactonase/LRE family protein [Cupriavidus sp. AU9028]|uniref:SMP-30/gluconolactonase/LRE family protein n=1 Tax=Cupriavidus sp. AU9028 TaxID=2871157 RepID=UPI001C97CD4E|nr:SMP-30/gluconolactonase/LRE family protein [Cupriavidus sp. AU9028]MBY4895532.1 SMP-30/gluconolactonase/LRE family protein [Cupriavidus sp. AU9028]
MQIERVGTLCTDLGECPVWDARQQRLWMLDCRRGHVILVDPGSGEHRVIELPAPLGSMALNGPDSVVVALQHEIALLFPATGALRTVAALDERHPHLRLNDGAAMPDGSFVVGTMHPVRGDSEPPLGGLYRLDPAGRLAQLDRDLAIVNGPVAHPSGKEVYVCDSAARAIYRYRIDSAGRWRARERFVDTQPWDSGPDGCCFDSEGGLWTALVRVGALARFDASGTLTHRIPLPVAHPASLCFGGEDLADLYVTTIRDSGRLRANGELDGALLRLRGTGWRGAPRPECRIAVPAMAGP